MEWFPYVFVILFGGLSASMFIHFLRGKPFYWYEPDKKMATLELLFSLGILVYGAVGLIKSI